MYFIDRGDNMEWPFAQIPERKISHAEAIKILEQGEFITVSTIDRDGKPYATPLSYYYEDGTIYIHTGTSNGRKKDSWQLNSSVMGVVVTEIEPCYEDSFFTTRYASAMIEGTIQRIMQPEKKKWVLAKICLKYLPEFSREISGAINREFAMTQVWAITINSLTGKAGRRKKDSPSIIDNIFNK